MARLVASASSSARAGQRMVLGLGVTGFERLLDQDVDGVAILGMHHDEQAVLRRLLHRAEERGVVDHQGAFVGHEELEAGDAPLRGLRDLAP